MTSFNESDQLLTTSEASARLGVADGAVRRFITQQRLPASRLGQYWVIRQSDLDAFAKQQPAPSAMSRAGRPAKAATRAHDKMLGLIAERPGITVVELAEATNEPRATALRRLQNLDRRGWVTRRKADRPKQPHQCYLTDRGWERYASRPTPLSEAADAGSSKGGDVHAED